MPRVVHFEIAAEDPERTSKFYGDVFGWQINKWDGPTDYWMAATGENGQPGIDGALMRKNGQPNSIINSIDVPSVDEYLERVTQSGGQVAHPKMAIPGIGYFAYCTDPENNIFGIIQFDEAAA